MAAKHRVKGYVGGGEVSRDKYGTISSFVDDPRMDMGGYPASRYVRSSGPGMQRDNGADEPEQKRKGGMIMKKPIKGYQRGGVIQENTAPGAASASSHKWSANMAGRDVTMRAKGGKVNKVARAKGKR